MIETLILALNLTNKDIYNNIDIYSMVEDKLYETQIASDIAILGPSAHDCKKYKSLPIFCFWKTNIYDNKMFELPDRAYLLITQIGTNINTTIPLDTPSNKLPLPSDDSTENIKVSDYDEYKGRTSYNEIWRDLTPTDFSWYNCQYTIQLICGKMLSNKINISITNAPIIANEAGNQSNSKKIIKDFDTTLFVKQDNSPEIPEKTNTIHITPVGAIKPEKSSFIVYGSFTLPTTSIQNNTQLELSLITQYSFALGFDHNKITIPIERTIQKNDNVSGYFTYDLKPIFYHSHTKTLKIPEIIYVNAMYGSISSKIIEVK